MVVGANVSMLPEDVKNQVLAARTTIAEQRKIATAPLQFSQQQLRSVGIQEGALQRRTVAEQQKAYGAQVETAASEFEKGVSEAVAQYQAQQQAVQKSQSEYELGRSLAMRGKYAGELSKEAQMGYQAGSAELKRSQATAETSASVQQLAKDLGIKIQGNTQQLLDKIASNLNVSTSGGQEKTIQRINEQLKQNFADTSSKYQFQSTAEGVTYINPATGKRESFTAPKEVISSMGSSSAVSKFVSSKEPIQVLPTKTSPSFTKSTASDFIKNIDTKYFGGYIPGFAPITSQVQKPEKFDTYNGIPYVSSETKAVEIGTGRIAIESGLTARNADLEDHYFIYTPDGRRIDVGILDPSKTGSVKLTEQQAIETAARISPPKLQVTETPVQFLPTQIKQASIPSAVKERLVVLPEKLATDPLVQRIVSSVGKTKSQTSTRVGVSIPEGVLKYAPREVTRLTVPSAFIPSTNRQTISTAPPVGVSIPEGVLKYTPREVTRLTVPSLSNISFLTSASAQPSSSKPTISSAFPVSIPSGVLSYKPREVTTESKTAVQQFFPQAVAQATTFAREQVAKNPLLTFAVAPGLVALGSTYSLQKQENLEARAYQKYAPKIEEINKINSDLIVASRLKGASSPSYSMLGDTQSAFASLSQSDQDKFIQRYKQAGFKLVETKEKLADGTEVTKQTLEPPVFPSGLVQTGGYYNILTAQRSAQPTGKLGELYTGSPFGERAAVQTKGSMDFYLGQPIERASRFVAGNILNIPATAVRKLEIGVYKTTPEGKLQKVIGPEPIASVIESEPARNIFAGAYKLGAYSALYSIPAAWEGSLFWRGSEAALGGSKAYGGPTSVGQFAKENWVELALYGAIRGKQLAAYEKSLVPTRMAEVGGAGTARESFTRLQQEIGKERGALGQFYSLQPRYAEQINWLGQQAESYAPKLSERLESFAASKVFSSKAAALGEVSPQILSDVSKQLKAQGYSPKEIKRLTTYYKQYFEVPVDYYSSTQPAPSTLLSIETKSAKGGKDIVSIYNYGTSKYVNTPSIKTYENVFEIPYENVPRGVKGFNLAVPGQSVAAQNFYQAGSKYVAPTVVLEKGKTSYFVYGKKIPQSELKKGELDGQIDYFVSNKGEAVRAVTKTVGFKITGKGEDAKVITLNVVDYYNLGKIETIPKTFKGMSPEEISQFKENNPEIMRGIANRLEKITGKKVEVANQVNAFQLIRNPATGVISKTATLNYDDANKFVRTLKKSYEIAGSFEPSAITSAPEVKGATVTTTRPLQTSFGIRTSEKIAKSSAYQDFLKGLSESPFDTATRFKQYAGGQASQTGEFTRSIGKLGIDLGTLRTPTEQEVKTITNIVRKTPFAITIPTKTVVDVFSMPAPKVSFDILPSVTASVLQARGREISTTSNIGKALTREIESASLVQIPSETTTPIEMSANAFSLSSSSRATTSTTQVSEQIQVPKQTQVATETFAPRTTTVTTTSRTTTSTREPTPTGRKPFPYAEDIKPIQTAPPKKKRKSVLARGYEPLIRRKGKYRSEFGFSVSEEEAKALGASKALGSAAATFKLVPSKKPFKSLGLKSPQNFDKLFRAPKNQEPGVFVQRKTVRITTPGEKAEISFAGISARRAQAARARATPKPRATTFLKTQRSSSKMRKPFSLKSKGGKRK